MSKRTIRIRDDGRMAVFAGLRDLRLRRCGSCIEIEEKFNTGWSGENAAKFASCISALVRSMNCMQLRCCLISESFSKVGRHYKVILFFTHTGSAAPLRLNPQNSRAVRNVLLPVCDSAVCSFM